MRTLKSVSPRISREPLTEQAKRILRSAILNGNYAPGTRLVETALAERHGITRHVMRAALQALEGEGLVVGDPFRGRSVAQPGAKDFGCVYLTRVALESLAAGLAAYRITKDQAASLLERARLPESPPRQYSQMVEWDTAIHREIWAIAGEPLLTEQLEKLIWRFMSVGAASLMGTPSSQALLERQIEREQKDDPAGHGPLLRAICAQDPAASRRAMVVHLFPSGTSSVSRETAQTVRAVFGLEPE